MDLRKLRARRGVLVRLTKLRTTDRRPEKAGKFMISNYQEERTF